MWVVNQMISFIILETGRFNFIIRYRNIVDAAYRFCRYELGTHVILSGTGDINHLNANIESFLKPPLPREDVLKLKKIFQNIDSISGD